ncbi:hypothetical protein [Candidatus Avelusimicrobium alvi]|uniref:hypothetical protein n=1 Tax=Candidatus Avelusimicrobium alvi TaxID=3416221 RepID=UPI003D0DB258
MTHTIIGIHLKNRTQDAAGLQEVLTRYGCSIKTRIGLHDVSDGACAPGGIILLEVISKQEELIQELSAKFDVQTMLF